MSADKTTAAEPWSDETCPVCGGSPDFGCQAVTTKEQAAVCPYEPWPEEATNAAG